MTDAAQAIDVEVEVEAHPDDRPLGPIIGSLAAEIGAYTVLSILALASLSILVR